MPQRLLTEGSLMHSMVLDLTLVLWRCLLEGFHMVVEDTVYTIHWDASRIAETGSTALD